MHGRWDLKNDSLEVANGTFAFSTSFTYDAQTVTCRFDYRSLRDSVPAGEMAADAAASGDCFEVFVRKNF